jgi:SAM-dependent methyltransferase
MNAGTMVSPAEQWAAVAPGWAANADHVDAMVGPLTTRLLELTDPQPGERVLELACGPGSVGLLAAERVGPSGEVVLSDVTSAMTAVAAERACARGFTNVATREIDLNGIDEPDGAYDVVLCREGFMFAREPAETARQIARILRPGGRVAVSVWGRRDRNPWLGLVFDAVTAQTGRQVPPPGAPCPFALGDPDRLAGALADGGLSGVGVSQHAMTVHDRSADAWFERRAALAGPLAKLLAGLPPAGAGALRAQAREAARPYETDGGVEFPALTLIASGRR